MSISLFWKNHDQVYYIINYMIRYHIIYDDLMIYQPLAGRFLVIMFLNAILIFLILSGLLIFYYTLIIRHN